MIFKIVPKKISGSFNAPPSKSFALRAIVAASLAEGISLIENVELCDDVKSLIFAFRKIGVFFEYSNKTLKVLGGVKENLKGEEIVIDCLDCGFTFRVFSFISAAFGLKIILKGTNELFKRPLICNLKLDGKKFFYIEKYNDSYKVKNKLVPGKYELECFVSSQFLTGLLFSLAILGKTSEIVLKEELQSKQYVKMTLYILKKFGVLVEKTRIGFKILEGTKFKAVRFFVEGDYLNSAIFSILGVFQPICVRGLNKKSLQRDKKIYKVIKKSGAFVRFKKDFIIVSPRKKKLKPFNFDVRETIDLAPCLSIFACFCDGISRIYGVERLKFKESDRIKAILELINNLGGSASYLHNCIIIKGGKKLRGGFVKGYKDHRIVMAAFSLSCFCKDFVFVSDSESVFKSNISFFDNFKALGGEFSGVSF